MDRAAVIALGLCARISAEERRLLLELFPSAGELFRLSAGECAEVLGRMPAPDWKPPAAHASRAERISRYLERTGGTLLVYGEQVYPAALEELYSPPFLLYLRGELPREEREWMAVVGTRTPSDEARAAAFAISAELVLSGICVVSGLAFGIDGCAHRGAVRYSGKTVAVLAHGVDAVYPGGHKDLAASILGSGGGLVSEYAPGTAPRRYHFPERNRIISGLCRGTLIVQAPAKSGALITADYALEQGRDVWVHTAGLRGERGAGTRRLRDEGAPEAGHADDILEEWGYGSGAARIREVDPREMTTADVMEEELAGRVTRFAGRMFRRAG
jgi:DNA processing protein